ncbi:MAG: VCBS domain-containing protein, partial [Methylococcaceae bacterium]
NDTDVDTGDSKTVSAVTGGTVGTAKVGSYGSLTLAADGSYTYTVDNSNSTVQALKGTTNTLTDSFTYTVKDVGNLTGTATLTVTVQGANDAPVGVNDSTTAIEAGGTGNATAGTNPIGNVLSNDTDVDTGDSKTVTALTGGTVGSAKTGSYGSLTLATNGSYTYTVDNSNSTVQALKGTANTLADSFTYTVKDVGGLTGTATLAVIVQGANDAPTGTDTSITIDEDSDHTFSADDFGFSDVDSGDTLSGIKITALEKVGTLTLDDNNVKLNQVISAENISKLKFTPVADEHNDSYDSFRFKVNDGLADSQSDYVITLNVEAVTDIPAVTAKVLNKTGTLEQPEDTYITSSSRLFPTGNNFVSTAMNKMFKSFFGSEDITVNDLKVKTSDSRTTAISGIMSNGSRLTFVVGDNLCHGLFDHGRAGFRANHWGFPIKRPWLKQ